jgi:hypothetical protein
MAGPANGAEKTGLRAAHNAVTQLDDSVQAQRLAARFAELNWPTVLNRWARQVNPLRWERFSRYAIHWVVDQAEFATNLLYASRTALAGLFRALLDYAVCPFTPRDILGFPGRKWDRRFDSEGASAEAVGALLLRRNRGACADREACVA